MTKSYGKAKFVFLQVLEPFALGILALLFIIPTITVMNLTPLTKELKKLDVLGVTSQEDIKIDMVGGKHEIFSNENLSKIDNNRYTYSTNLNKRASDIYSKPILKISNRGSADKKVVFFGQTLSNTRSDVFLMIGKEKFRIQDGQGETYKQEITIKAGSEETIFLSIENLSGVQFSEIFDMDISVFEE